MMERLYYFYFGRLRRAFRVYALVFVIVIAYAWLSLGSGLPVQQLGLQCLLLAVILSTLFTLYMGWQGQASSTGAEEAHALIDAPRSFTSTILFLCSGVGAILFCTGTIIFWPQPHNVRTYSAVNDGKLVRATTEAFLTERTNRAFDKVALAKKHFETAQVLSDRRVYGSAEAEYRKSIDAVPTVSAHLNLSVALREDGKFQDAKSEFDAARLLANRNHDDTLEVAMNRDIGPIFAPVPTDSVAREDLAPAPDEAEQEATVASLRKFEGRREFGRIVEHTTSGQKLRLAQLAIRHARASKPAANQYLQVALHLARLVVPAHDVVSQQSADDLRQQLLDYANEGDEKVPAFWPLVGVLLNSPFVNNRDASINEPVPSCPSIGDKQLTRVQLVNCAQVLDGYSFDTVTFEHVLIRYNGGPVELREVRFKDCHFQVNLRAAPRDGGRTFATELLAYNGTPRDLSIPGNQR